MTESRDAFSVVLLASAHERAVSDSIASLWAQTTSNFEIVVVNDGGDSGHNRLASLPAESPRRMSVVKVPDAGRAAAMNAGALAASGRYIAFLIAGDAFHPDRLEVFRRAIVKSPPFEWGFSGVQAIDAAGQRLEDDEIRDLELRQAVQRSQVPLEAIRALGRKNALVSSGNIVVARERFLNAGGFRDLRVTEGWDLALRLLDGTQPYAAERPLYLLRIPTENKRWRRRDEQLRGLESARVVADHRRRLAARPEFVPPQDPMADLPPDEAAAVRSILWALGKLRGFPPAYVAVRTSVRVLRKLRRH